MRVAFFWFLCHVIFFNRRKNEGTTERTNERARERVSERASERTNKRASEERGSEPTNERTNEQTKAVRCREIRRKFLQHPTARVTHCGIKVHHGGGHGDER